MDLVPASEPPRRVAAALLGAFALIASAAPFGAAEALVTDAVKNAPPYSLPALLEEEVVPYLSFRVPDDIKAKILDLPPAPAAVLPAPILIGVSPEDIENTWREPRSGGRLHEGADIIAPRGAFVVSPSDIAVVTKTGYDRHGGVYVITVNPGGEEFYYAHLDAVAPGLAPGAVLGLGDLVGYIGNTGNARDASPHLHFGIYVKGEAVDPHPRLTATIPPVLAMQALGRILKNSPTDLLDALDLVKRYEAAFISAETAGAALPEIIAVIRKHPAIRTSVEALPDSIALKAEGNGVAVLQSFLIGRDAGPKARALAAHGPTGHFGHATQAALAEYQRAEDITPAAGYFGPLTKSRVARALYYEPVRNFERALALAEAQEAARIGANQNPLTASSALAEEAHP